MMLRARLLGSLDAARGLEGVGDSIVIKGYYFGGAAVLEVARAGMDLDGVVSFHGGLGTPEGQDHSQASGPILPLHGTADPVSGPADLAQVVGEMLGGGRRA